MSGVPRKSEKNEELKPEIRKRRKRKKKKSKPLSGFMEGMQIINSSNKQIPYRFIKNGVDYTPLPLDDERFSEIKGPYDVSDFVTLFLKENYVQNSLPLFLIEDHSAMIDGFLTGYKYGISTFPLERILAHPKPDIKKKAIEDELERRPTTYTTFEETFKVTLQETETIHLLTVDSSLSSMKKEDEIFADYGEYDEEEEIGDAKLKEKEEEGEKEVIRGEYGDLESPMYDQFLDSVEISLPESPEKSEPIVKSDEYERYLKALRKGEISENYSLSFAPFNKTKAVNTNETEYESKSLAVSPSMIGYAFTSPEEVREKRVTTDIRYKNVDQENISKSVLDSITFNDVFHVVEKTLENYYYKKEQINLQRSSDEDIAKHHSLSIAMRFKLPTEVTLNKTYEVTSVSWHPLNRNLIGVGYGKMHLEKKIKTGMFCIWNIKCPTMPERAYKFEYPVTCIGFNDYYPYAAVVTFITGHAVLINILSKKLSLIGDSFDHPCDLHPVTDLSWFKGEFGGYFPVISTKAGNMYRFKTENEFTGDLLLDLPRKPNVTKGIQQTWSQYPVSEDIKPIKVGISTFTQHPQDPLTYLVGTDDGLVHVCSSVFKLRDTDAFVAHDGPITSIDFHPFTNRIFLTSGNDRSVRIWTTCMLHEPILTLSARHDYVRKAKWSTKYPMIIFAMSEAYIDIWDIARPCSTVPISTYENYDRTNNLTFNVSPFGNHLIVGCADGVAELLILNEREDEPKFRLETFFKALRNHIENTDEQLWKQLKALIPELAEAKDGDVDVLNYLD